MPVATADRLGAGPGVERVVPRIVGEIRLGAAYESAVLVGLPPESFPAGITCVEGRLCAASGLHELVVGSELAQRLGLSVGAMIPPFYRNDRGERVSQVVGTFRADGPLWQSHVVLTTLAAAQTIYGEEGRATQLLVTCREGWAPAVQQALAEMTTVGDPADPVLKPRAVARDDLTALLSARLLRREGWFSLNLALAFAIGVPILLVSTGFGLSERRREAGLLKAVGWGTDEVLLRSLVESVALGLVGGSVAVLVSVVWLRFANGAGIAPLFLPAADITPGFVVPFRIAPLPLLLGVLIGLAVTVTGSLWSSWRACSAPPAEVLR